jgi:hypothetical protein
VSSTQFSDELIKNVWRFSYSLGNYSQSVLDVAVIASYDVFHGFIMKGHWKRIFAWLTCHNLQGRSLDSLAFETHLRNQSSSSNEKLGCQGTYHRFSNPLIRLGVGRVFAIGSCGLTLKRALCCYHIFPSISALMMHIKGDSRIPIRNNPHDWYFSLFSIISDLDFLKLEVLLFPCYHCEGPFNIWDTDGLIRQ